MKTLITFPLLVVLALAGVARADRKAQPTAMSPHAATLAQIEQTIGFVPAFVKTIPAALLPSWWGTITAIEDNPNTKLDAKTKQLVALGVAAQIPCELCVYYHTEAARLYGASDQEVQETVAMAAGVRQNSTLLNGLQADKVQFRKDIERIVRTAKQAAKQAAKK